MATIVRERFRLVRMTREFAPQRLDVPGFADAAASISGNEPLQAYARLSAEVDGPADGATVQWQATGQRRPGIDGAPVSWLHLVAGARIPLACQRCLKPVDVELAVDRWFRFAADEATAAAEDEASEEDVLVASREFDLRGLIEDELLMDIPVTPRHDVCPEPMKLSSADSDFDGAEADRPNPFAVLGSLRTGKSE